MVFGKSFPYRCYKNPDPKKNVTLLVLAGGSGPADGFFYLCDDLMPEYNLLSFDYPQAFPDNASLAGETLLFFSKEDTIFTESMKQNLVDLMTDPDVVWDLKGGHLAMMASLDEYLRTLHAFLRARNENYQ